MPCDLAMPGPGMNGSSPNGPPQAEPGVSKAAIALKAPPGPLNLQMPPGPLNLQMPVPGPLNLQMPAGPLQLSAPSPLLFQSGPDANKLMNAANSKSAGPPSNGGNGAVPVFSKG